MSFTRGTKKKIALGYMAWWLLWALLDAYALVNTIGLPWKDAIIDAINTNLILATAGNFIYNALRFYQPSPGKRFYLLIIWSITIAILCVGLQNLITIHYPYWHDQAYLTFFSNSLIMRGLFFWLMITLIMILCWIWFYIEEQQANEKRESDAVNLAREAELSKLRQQLQPHFLFNSLNSISALVGQPEEARRMIQQLSDFLRGTLKKDEQQLVCFNEELQHLQLYLEIEKVRFGHRLETEIVHDETTHKMTLPSLVLQPIVENAIKFGLYDTVGSITIRITAKRENNYLLVEVENPFDQQLAPRKSGTGFGLNSIQRRLYLLYARNDLLSTRQNENIFTTHLKIPQSL